MATKRFKSNIDLEQNELLKAKIENSTVAPGTPVLGQIYFDTNLDQFGVYTNSGWAYLDSGNINNIITPGTDGIDVSITNGVATITQLAASSSQNGYMSSTDKQKLDDSTDDSTPNTLMERDGSGNTSVNMITINDQPSNPTDGVNKQYVDGIAQGLTIKEPVRAIATQNKTLSGLQTVDGVSLQDGDRILVALQTDPTEEGIWIVRTSSWERADDFSAGDNVANAFMFVSEGTQFADTGWVCTNDGGSDVVGTDDLIFVQFSSAGVVDAGAGLTKTGNNIDVNAGDDTITVNPNNIEVRRDPSGAIGVNANGVEVNTDTNYVDINSNQLTIGNYTSKIAFDNVTIGTSSGAQTITHNFNSRNLNVQIIDDTTYEQIEAEIVYTSVNDITVSANGPNVGVIVIITGNVGENLV